MPLVISSADLVRGNKRAAPFAFKQVNVIANTEALRDAVGATRPSRVPVRLDAPATPERVLRAIEALARP